MKYWVAMDRLDTESVFIYKEKPIRNEKDGYWEGESLGALSQTNFGLNLTWESEPVEIEINT